MVRIKVKTGISTARSYQSHSSESSQGNNNKHLKSQEEYLAKAAIVSLSGLGFSFLSTGHI
jgi:hypothetical protein